MRKILTFYSLLLAPLSALQAADPPAARPNIVFIMADDHGPWAYGAAGNPEAKTPHMDRLAREGSRFVNAFTPTPVCSPARASVMTSRYGSELGITDYIRPNAEIGLAANVPTWPRILQQAGYDTALFGKWHLGNLDDQHPTQRGYGTFVGFRGGGNTPQHPLLEKDGVTTKREGFVVDLVADEAVAWLRKQDATRPFAISIHFREPHAPYLPVREEDWNKVKELDPQLPNPVVPDLDTERMKKTMRDYLASVAAIDRNLGQILDTLDQLRLADRTLLIYTSDHGYNIGHHGVHHKGNGHWMLKKESLPPSTPHIPAGQRPNMYDTSIHIPLLIRWPGVVSPGTVETHTVSHLDWLPTFAELGGGRIPERTTLRGRSLVPLLRRTAQQWNDDFYAEYSMHQIALVHMRMYRTTQWKLMRDFNNEGRDELYHLAVDPDETRNLISDSSPETKRILADLDARILARMQETGDPVLPQARVRSGN